MAKTPVKSSKSVPTKKTPPAKKEPVKKVELPKVAKKTDKVSNNDISFDLGSYGTLGVSHAAKTPEKSLALASSFDLQSISKDDDVSKVDQYIEKTSQ